MNRTLQPQRDRGDGGQYQPQSAGDSPPIHPDLCLLDDLASGVDRGQSLVRVLLQALAQELTDLRGGLRRKQAPVGLTFQHRGDGFLHGVGAKGAFTCEQFVEEASEGPDVRSRIHRFAARLLRAHVSRRADHVARHGSGGVDVLRLSRSLVLVPIDRLRQTEVQDLHLAFRCDHHVRGLEVAVDDASCVSGCESLCDLLRRFAAPRQLAVAPPDARPSTNSRTRKSVPSNSSSP